MKEKIFWAPVVAGVIAMTLTFSGCTKSSASKGQQAAGAQPTGSVSGATPLATLTKAAQPLVDSGQSKAAAGDHTGSSIDYARAGELLMMPEGFQLADQFFDLALQQDPTNAKALIYKSVTEPGIALRGYIARIEPLIVSDTDQKAVERLRQNLKTYNMPELEDFSENLAPGQQPFQSYHDVQRFVRTQLLPAIQNSVDRLSKVDATTPIQLNFTPERLLINPVSNGGQYTYYYDYCSNYNGNESCDSGQYSYEYHDSTPRNLYFLDQHDLGILKNSMMGVVDSIRVATAYSFQDSEFAMRRLKALSEIRQDSGKKLTAQDVVGVFASYPSLFTLETDNQLAAIAANSSQALKYGIDLANMKATLCDASTRTIANSLFAPICIEASVVDSMKTGINLLAGPTAVTIGTDKNGNNLTSVVDINAILNNPPKDLKSLLPNQFDSQGNPTNYPDATMGGLFPNADFISQLQLIGSTANVKKVVHAVDKAVNAVKSHI